MKQKVLHLFLSLMLTSIGMYAQTGSGRIEGVVIDDAAEEPLPGATVFIEELKKGFIADKYGEFSFSNIPTATYTLTVKYMGYHTQTRKVTVGKERGKKIIIRLRAEAQSLNEVVVMGKSETRKQLERPSMITMVEMKKFEGRVLSFQDILNQSVGIKVLQQGGLGSSSRTFVQGLDGKSIKIFVDGMPTGSSDEFQISAIPVDMVKNVEIYKGIVPAWLGGDGLSGAINIITQDYNGQDHLEASYAISSFNTHQAHVAGSKNLAKMGIGVYANGMFESSDNNYKFKSPYVSSPAVIESDHNAFRIFRFNIGISFRKLWFDNLSFSLGTARGRQELQGGVAVIQQKITDTHKKNETYHTSLNLAKNSTDGKLKFNLHSLVEYNVEHVIDTCSYKHNWDGSVEKRTIPGEWGSFPNNSSDKYWTINELFKASYQLDHSHSFIWNISYKYNKKSPYDPLNDQYSAYSATGYPSSLHSMVSGLTYGLNLWNGKLKNELSGKLFHHQASVLPGNEGLPTSTLITTKSKNTSLGWSEAIAWKPIEQLTVKASLSKVVRIPTAMELFGDGIIIDQSPSLKPEKSTNVNIGLSYTSSNPYYPRMHADVNAFYMNVEEMIKLLTTGGVRMAFVNLDKAVIKGIEVDWGMDATSWLTLRGNFTYQDLRDNNKEAAGGGTNWHYNYRIPNTPYCFGSGGIKLHRANLTGRNTLSSLSFDAEYTHAFSYSWEANNQNNLKIPERLSLNVGLHQSIHRHYHLSFEVHNLMNKEHWAEFRYPLPGRSFHFKLKYVL